MSKDYYFFLISGNLNKIRSIRQDPEKDNSGGQSEYKEESIDDETSNKSTKIQSENNLRRRSETVGEFIFPTI